MAHSNGYTVLKEKLEKTHEAYANSQNALSIYRRQNAAMRGHLDRANRQNRQLRMQLDALELKLINRVGTTITITVIAAAGVAFWAINLYY